MTRRREERSAGRGRRSMSASSSSPCSRSPSRAATPARSSEARDRGASGCSRSRSSRSRAHEPAMNPLHLLLGLAPVTAFLAGLVVLDSFKLVRRADVAKSLGAGVLAAGLSLAVNVAAMRSTGVSAETLARFLAPLIEESAKAALIVWLVRTGRLGFLVDAAIHGFAIGAGFALVENLYYAQAVGTGSLGLWVVRGFGTAIMHGTATAIFAILAKGLTERHGSMGLRWFLPGFAAAVAIHAGFNLFLL